MAITVTKIDNIGFQVDSKGTMIVSASMHEKGPNGIVVRKEENLAALITKLNFDLEDSTKRVVMLEQVIEDYINKLDVAYNKETKLNVKIKELETKLANNTTSTPSTSTANNTVEGKLQLILSELQLQTTLLRK